MASFKENKEKIEAFLVKPWNLASVLPELCSERLISQQEKLEINLTGPSRRAHTVTKILEHKITRKPELFIDLMEILQYHKFEEGGEADSDYDDSDLPPGMTIIDTDEMIPFLKDVSLQSGSVSHQMASLSVTDTEATKERVQLQTADSTSEMEHQALTLESVPSTKSTLKSSRTDPPRSHAATVTATATRSVKLKKRKPRSRATATSSADIERRKVYTGSQLRRLKEAEADYPGIEFSAYYSMVDVTKKGGVIRGEGIQLRIPPNATEKKSRTISLRACIDGPFQLPEDVHLASPVFLVTCTPSNNFYREVTLTLHHFVQLTSREECERMVLLTSPQTAAVDKHWRFEISEKQPLCFQNFTQGEVEVTHFSFMCFGIRIPRLGRTQAPQNDVPHYHYRAFVYSPRLFSLPSCFVLFSICLDQEVYRMRLQNMVDSDYGDCNLKKTNDIPCSIEREVTVIPPDSVPGYVITSNQAPIVILKEIVDRTRLRWWRRRRDDPPWILFTVSRTDPTRARDVSELQFKVKGINNRAFDGFNLATHHVHTATTSHLPPIQAPPVHRAGYPTMPNLLNFNAGTRYLNIPREIGTSYNEFGIHLLQDDNGVRVSALERQYHGAVEHINRHILQEWLQGRGSPVLWATLVDAMRTIELNELATLIERHT